MQLYSFVRSCTVFNYTIYDMHPSCRSIPPSSNKGNLHFWYYIGNGQVPCWAQVKILDNILSFTVMLAISRAVTGKVTQLVANMNFISFSAGWILVELFSTRYGEARQAVCIWICRTWNNYTLFIIYDFVCGLSRGGWSHSNITRDTPQQAFSTDTYILYLKC